MTLTERFTGTSDTYAGKVAYRSCLSCDSVLSERIEYSPSSSTTITNWKRYEYDGLNLLRVDEKYDTAGGSIDENDPWWRKKEVAAHKPGTLGNMLGKTVYNYTNNTDTPSSSAFYVYYYDAVGNVIWIEGSGGVLQYSFTQDAFGNELSCGSFSGNSWSTARAAGITEHQTGKWIDPFTGLYYFHARWYDPVVGRFVGRDPKTTIGGAVYGISYDNPVKWADPSGMEPISRGCDLGFQRCPAEESKCHCDCSRLKSQLMNAQRNLVNALLCYIAGDETNPACTSLHPRLDANCENLRCNILGITSRIRKTGELVPFYNPDEAVLHRCGRYCICAHEAVHVVLGQPKDPVEGALHELFGYSEEEICLQEKLRSEGCDQ